ncbi:MAG: tRNA uridine-5-carboxymethylaminomethyl(34) synthesis GTPase MnmE [Gammaproteobacteria bacterium]|nr:tRNA uridine-5-carboxymethylaminomethyl(34) synthesis GTPase MnmE [Gammaproteobacteria bacterium]
MKNKTETIAAKATPPGRGGVGIIRVSGPMVLSITHEILGKSIKARIVNSSNFFSTDKKIIDQGLAIYFSAPQSFTGEDVLELHGHGGQVVMDLLLQRVLDLGARLAKPGEFIERGFLNHKLDLIQVEAVADLINASSSQAAQNAARSLQGEFSKKINKLVADLIDIRVSIEAAIDFVEEEEVEKTIPNDFERKICDVLGQIKELKNKSKQGILLRDGINVVITGDTNAGKSSLLNCFSGQDTAIVTDIPGTTRDVLHVWTQLDGLPLNLLDTAGFNDKPDLIEVEGIRRAWEEIKKADHVLLMIDGDVNRNRNSMELSSAVLKEIPDNCHLTVLYNKIDLTGEPEKISKEGGINTVYLSAQTGQGIDLLKEHLKDKAGFCTIEDGFSARVRHLDALDKAEKYLENINNDLLVSSKIEIIAQELNNAQMVLGEITGEVTPDDLLGKIFSEFCVGK